jgi:predicted phosphodiesterase
MLLMDSAWTTTLFERHPYNVENEKIFVKIHILSDLHIEFAPFSPPKTDADVIVLAGDIHIKSQGINWIKAHFPVKPVIYVLGNHEYYGEAIPKLTEKLKELTRGTHIHVLENDALEIDDVLFLGSTLWTDFRLYGDPRIAGYFASQQMTDYRKIHVSPDYHRLRSLDTATFHARSRSWLENELMRNSGRKIIVITHHALSKRSIPEQFQEDIVSAAYASNLEELIEKSGARLWIHGHIHTCQDYQIGETRVLCNPRGYPNEYGNSFNPGLVVEI